MKKIREIIRSLIVVFHFGLFGVGGLFLRYCVIPFKKDIKEKRKVLQNSWKFFIWLLKKFKIIKFEFKGLEKIQNLKETIVVSTHPSFLDIVILMSIIPNSTCFVGERLAQNIFFKGMIELFFIKEGQPVKDWTKECCNMLDKGMNVIVFPSGIRHRKNEHPKIRRGVAMIAQASMKNIAIIKMSTSFDFLYIHQPFYEAGSETVTYYIDYAGTINTTDFINESKDEVSFKTKLVKKISETLYEQ